MISGRSMLLPLLCSTSLASMTMAADPADSLDDEFQVNALFDPSEAQLRAEATGRVMIYDGLHEDLVEQALDEEFERVEHMMFINIRREQPDDVVVASDDDC
ncbi:MAG: hypothetical protein PVG38_00615 [Gammaproteobacteria bacterium]